MKRRARIIRGRGMYVSLVWEGEELVCSVRYDVGVGETKVRGGFIYFFDCGSGVYVAVVREGRRAVLFSKVWW